MKIKTCLFLFFSKTTETFVNKVHMNFFRKKKMNINMSLVT